MRNTLPVIFKNFADKKNREKKFIHKKIIILLKEFKSNELSVKKLNI